MVQGRGHRIQCRRFPTFARGFVDIGWSCWQPGLPGHNCSVSRND